MWDKLSDIIELVVDAIAPPITIWLGRVIADLAGDGGDRAVRLIRGIAQAILDAIGAG